MNFSNRGIIAGGGGIAAVFVLSLVAVPPAQADSQDDDGPPDENARYWMECEFERHDGQHSVQEPGKDSLAVHVDILSDYPTTEYHSHGGQRHVASDIFRLSLTPGTANSSDVQVLTRTMGVSRRQGEGHRTRNITALEVDADSRREHDETFSVSFTIDGVDVDDQASYVKDMDDPRYDNKCDFTIIDHRNDALDVSQVFHFFGEYDADGTGPGTEMITGPVGNYTTDSCDSSELDFYADWIPRYESGGSWHEIDADEWEYDILWAEGGLADADFAIWQGSYTYTVTTATHTSARYGLEPDDEITIPTIDGTITGGGDERGSFHLRVRAKVDGEWQPYLIPMYFGCATGGV